MLSSTYICQILLFAKNGDVLRLRQTLKPANINAGGIECYQKKKQSPGGVLLKGVLKNFTKLTGKHLCQSLFFNKVATFSKKETLAQVLSCKFCEIFKNTFFIEHFRTTASVYSDFEQQSL